MSIPTTAHVQPAGRQPRRSTAGVVAIVLFVGGIVAVVAGMIMLINTPGGRVWWEEARQLVSADFSKFLHGRYERDGASVPRWDAIQTHMRLPAGQDTGNEGAAP
jgi:hypothetical protein